MKNFLIKTWKAFCRFLSFIPKDKALHFVVNFALALSGFISYWLPVGLCIGASVGKEYGDSKASGNKWSWGDIVADMLGMGCGLCVVWGIRSLFGF
mgnify:CR=1 FL=1